MRILARTESVPAPALPPTAEAPAIRLPMAVDPAAAPAGGVDAERVTVLEAMVKSLMEKCRALDERLQALEKENMSSPGPLPLEDKGRARTQFESAVPGGEPMNRQEGSPTTALGDDGHDKRKVVIDAAAIKKGVLDQMWKHLKDGR